MTEYDKTEYIVKDIHELHITKYDKTEYTVKDI